MLVRARGHPLTMISVDHVGFWLLFAFGCGRVGGVSDLGQGNQDWVQNIFGNIPSRLAKNVLLHCVECIAALLHDLFVICLCLHWCVVQSDLEFCWQKQWMHHSGPTSTTLILLASEFRQVTCRFNHVSALLLIASCTVRPLGLNYYSWTYKCFQE